MTGCGNVVCGFGVWLSPMPVKTCLSLHVQVCECLDPAICYRLHHAVFSDGVCHIAGMASLSRSLATAKRRWALQHARMAFLLCCGVQHQ